MLVSKALDVVRTLAPPLCAKHDLYIINTLERVLTTLSSDIFTDVVIFTCVYMLFWAITCIDKLTVLVLSCVDSAILMCFMYMHTNIDHSGNCVVVLHVPYIKSAKEHGKDLSFTLQPSLFNSVAALKCQVQINSPLDAEYLFIYIDSQGVHYPLSCSVFLVCICHVCIEASVDALFSHAFRTGSILEYFLYSLSFDAVHILDR